MRKIPATMATQHPDNAGAPYWDAEGQSFISVYQEIVDAVACFQDLGVSEYMWDWEGKHADAAVIDRLFGDYHDYFSEHQLGRDKFLTFRIPNIWEEKGYNLMQAMTVILSSEDFARDLGLSSRPLFEVILPMTERPEQLIRIHTLFEKLARFKNTDFTKKEPDNNDYLEMIPLIESVESQLAVADLLTGYVELHERHFGRRPEYIRVFLACSDSSLSSGFLAGLLGNKLALARLHEFSERTDIPIFPIFGPGSLCFRGGLAPDTIDRFVQEFPGVRTVTVQSAFRYDHPLEEVKAAIARLEAKLPKAKPVVIDTASQQQLVNIAQQSANLYQNTLKGILPDMQPIFKAVPKRRDRRQHIGLLAYGRSLGEQKLPRAITFTAGFYSLGVPPEFIGIGRTLQKLKPAELELLRSKYHNLSADLETAGRYLNMENLAELAKRGSAWKDAQTDIKFAEQVLGLKFGPHTQDEKAHRDLSSNVLLSKNDPAKLTQLINETAILRGSLG